ncbi:MULTISPECIES: alternative ribosome rescue aminoacyl-tRNA hydrolase ArfB [unclassified Nocardiopsis]|uniref:alternative ribosome rescue aminoacyl-tRNA hydrolase ArfB n=1 Tax=unclassified Nocardiopsis TaxID=2649073 RepID=UPI00066C66C4|nr:MULTISPECIES: alternative ribosome rescue aminoacyl-tRNA hydrolase ArfB [unclassified Nocardiopsis]MBQ1082750.1 aminoacyl-tRNA hydrolase [Nocardiopsis sp. B62]
MTGQEETTGGLAVGPVTVPADALTWRFSRSSGPGGQHVNTSDTRVSLSLDVASCRALGATRRARALERLSGRLVDGVLTVSAQTHRSQVRNRAEARERLAAILAEAIAPPPPERRSTRPSRASKRRRLDAKRRRSDVKKSRSRPPMD